MANLNKVLLMGNLTRDPEMRVTPGGLSICKFGLAVNRVWRDKEGNQQEETTFVDIDAFGRQAETISKYVTKGRGLFVEGRLKLDQWESNAGEKRSKLKVILDNFQFIGGRGEGGESGGGGGYASDDSGSSASYEDNSPPSRPARPASAPKPAAKDDIEDDVPF